MVRKSDRGYKKMNDAASFFTGRTERFLVEKLVTEGSITADFIYSVYSSREGGASFMSKLVTFKLAKLVQPGFFQYITEEERSKEKM